MSRAVYCQLIGRQNTALESTFTTESVERGTRAWVHFKNKRRERNKSEKEREVERFREREIKRQRDRGREMSVWLRGVLTK